MNDERTRQIEIEQLHHWMWLKLSEPNSIGHANEKLLAAARWFESNSEKGVPTAIEDRFLSAIGYYLSGHYACSYALFNKVEEIPELLPAYSLLRGLFRKELASLFVAFNNGLSSLGYSEAQIVAELKSGAIQQKDAVERAIVTALRKAFEDIHRFTRTGSEAAIDSASNLINSCYLISADAPFLSETPYPALLLAMMGMTQELHQSSLWKNLADMLTDDSGGLVGRYIQHSAKRLKPVIELWPSQITALPKINEGSPGQRTNFPLKMPTSAGKTMVAELAILRTLIDEAGEANKKCVYVAPFKSLGTEVETKLRKHFHSLGIGVSDLYGGFEISPTDRFLFERQRIIVATPEKMDALLRYIPDFAAQIGLVFLDEGHIIEDNERGMRFELFAHRLFTRYVSQQARIIMASAVLGSGDSLTKWMTQGDSSDGLVCSQYRPTRNYLGLLLWDGTDAKRELTYESVNTPSGYQKYTSLLDVRVRALPKIGNRKFPRKKPKEVLALTALREAKDGMTLVFSPLPENVVSIGASVLEALDYIACCRSKNIAVDNLELQQERLSRKDQTLLDRCINLAKETTGKDSVITQALERRFVVHHGRVPEQLRNALAPLIEKGVFNLVVATNTITNGVNAPVKTLLIHTVNRGSQESPVNDLPPQEFFNLVGRAGRANMETHGIALLFSEFTKATYARGKLNAYVAKYNSLELRSALKAFLQRVAEEWQDKFPGVGIVELCLALAEHNVSWLAKKSGDQLDELDRSIIALLQETDTSPENVQTLFEKSLMALQANSDSNAWDSLQSLQELLVARTKYIQKKMPHARRSAFYRSGLPLSDCLLLESHVEIIGAHVTEIGRVRDYSEKEVVEIIWKLYEDILSKLSIFTSMKRSPPSCIKHIMFGWVSGKPLDQIAMIPEVQSENMSLLEIGRHKDEFCSERMPWALNAIRGYVQEIAPEESAVADDWLSTWSAMVHFGLPTPKAAIFYALGLRLREAAIFCASQCKEKAVSPLLHNWLAKIGEDEIEGWNTSDAVKYEALAYKNGLEGVLL